MTEVRDGGDADQLFVNEVRLVGRLAAAPEDRELPSGDRITIWRLVVARPPDRTRPGGPRVDALACVAFRGDVRRRSASWTPGDVLEVHGALRRRFWREAGGAANRCEVEVQRVRRVGGRAT